MFHSSTVVAGTLYGPPAAEKLIQVHVGEGGEVFMDPKTNSRFCEYEF